MIISIFHANSKKAACSIIYERGGKMVFAGRGNARELKKITEICTLSGHHGDIGVVVALQFVALPAGVRIPYVSQNRWYN